MPMNELTQRGIAALKAGDRDTARQLLGEAVKQNPSDAAAWLWLSGAVESDGERVACLQRVLRIDPENQHAGRGLAQIQERRARAAEQAVQQSEPAAQQPEPVAQQPEPVAQQPEPVVQPSDPEGEPPQPVVEQAQAERADTVEAPISPLPAARVRRSAVVEDSVRVFRTRPSQVPALLAFWLFLFGAVALGQILSQAGEINLPLAAVLGLVLEVVVIYVVIRNFTSWYELTSRKLTLPYQGKRVSIPLADILSAEQRQNLVQKMLGTGDVIIDAVVGGRLTHLRMRDVPEVRHRVEQLTQARASHEPQRL
jgi:hypothetical protein